MSKKKKKKKKKKKNLCTVIYSTGTGVLELRRNTAIILFFKPHQRYLGHFGIIIKP